MIPLNMLRRRQVRVDIALSKSIPRSVFCAFNFFSINFNVASTLKRFESRRLSTCNVNLTTFKTCTTLSICWILFVIKIDDSCIDCIPNQMEPLQHGEETAVSRFVSNKSGNSPSRTYFRKKSSFLVGEFLNIETLLTRMWANAQRNGRPAEYRWRPLFNAESLADAHY